MMNPAKRDAAEVAAIREALDALPLPDTVREYRGSLRPDSEGEPGVYILFLMDDRLDEKAFLSEVSRITDPAMSAILDAPGTERLPYPRYRYFSEQSEIDSDHPGQNW